MMEETLRNELKGRWLRFVIEDERYFLTLPDTTEPVLRAYGEGSPMTAKDAAKVIDELAAELRQIREKLDDMGGIPPQTPPPETVVIYSDVEALNAKHAREVAYKRSLEEHPDLVLNVKNCERVTNNPYLNLYRILGWTTPRLKAPRKKAGAAPVEGATP